jgi:subtilisin family serine protease
VPDPLLGQQWHLKSNTLEVAGANVQPIWPTSRGSGIVLGVVDDGLQHTHPDLQPNYRAALSADVIDQDGDPNPTGSDEHGTSVSGLAAARGDNGIGVSGVAPLAGLAGIRFLDASGSTSDQQEAQALQHALQDVHIVNNSWGPTDFPSSNRMVRPGPLSAAAITNAIQNGRGGRGRIFVWAAGNGGGSGDDCNYDGYANQRTGIAVAALADSGTRAYYSDTCAALIVTAPSSGGSRGLVTTDRTGTVGYDAGDYTTAFGGTSGAAPIVSGVVALMLGRNPNLAWRDVQAILRETSRRVNAGDSDWTPGAYPHHHSYGFGVVDATAAVQRAATWAPLSAELSYDSGTQLVNAAIPDANATGVQRQLVFTPPSPSFVVEHVEVILDATHGWRGDLEVVLTSPSGVTSRLAPRRPSDSGDHFVSWPLWSVRHWGETGAGTWTLRVADRDPIVTGTVNWWQMRIYGHLQ